MKKKFFYMKDKIKSKKERKSRKEEKINLNEILKDESYKLGTFRRNGRGFGFVNVGEEDEIFISPKLTKNALDGDEVLIRIFDDNEAQNGKHKREGKILQITKHAQDMIVGVYKKSRNFGFVIPDDQAVSGDIYIPKKKSANAKNNQKVVVKIDKYSDGVNKAEGTIVEIIGGIDEAGVDMMSLIKEYKLPNEFPENVDVLFINKSMETAINIYTNVPNVVVHSANKSAQVQARGRIRNDIENLYVLTPDTRYIDLTDRRINDYFNKPLDVEQKAALVQAVGLKDSQSHKVGWPTLKKALCENGCTILTHRMGTKNYDVIMPPDSVED